MKSKSLGHHEPHKASEISTGLKPCDNIILPNFNNPKLGICLVFSGKIQALTEGESSV